MRLAVLRGRLAAAQLQAAALRGGATLPQALREVEQAWGGGGGGGGRIGSEPEHAGCGAASWLVAAAQALDLVAEAESQPSRQRVVVGVAGSPVIYTSLGENEAT